MGRRPRRCYRVNKGAGRDNRPAEPSDARSIVTGKSPGRRPSRAPHSEPGEILRGGDGREKNDAGMADALSSVKGPVRAEPIVHYTIKSTVNRHRRTLLGILPRPRGRVRGKV